MESKKLTDEQKKGLDFLIETVEDYLWLWSHILEGNKSIQQPWQNSLGLRAKEFGMALKMYRGE